MPKWLLPWLLPLGLLVVVIAVATSALGVALVVVAGLVGLPFVCRAYQTTRDSQAGSGAPKPRRPDPPNNRSWLR
jgi:Flp pilus assembly protein TadB